MHRRLQPLVTSQKISRGVYSFFAGCAPLLPSVIAVSSPPISQTSARFLCLYHRILATRGAVSGITRACDARHFREGRLSPVALSVNQSSLNAKLSYQPISGRREMGFF